eukprot:TRINITY_DN12641_c0_g1_i2.p1 TRINITY_DN12641_c0_g1~~TRINITY_DN12641_c0_g1_i2.p1  ORF type:complete len:329 (-),score=85.81 TRINITY_DN12641_c0_g1_i2:34-1020(-)
MCIRDRRRVHGGERLEINGVNMNEEDLRDAQRTRWKKWMAERDAHRQLDDFGINTRAQGDDQAQILTELTAKITAKMKDAYGGRERVAHNNGEIKMEKMISKELESNTCGICYELMLPPTHSPLLLFPCGHTFCKACMIGPDKQFLKKCPVCRVEIRSHAINISLQNLICIYTNNKHLLDRVSDDPAPSPSPKNEQQQMIREHYENAELRTKILKEELKECRERFAMVNEKQNAKQEVINQLQGRKREIETQIEKLRAEAKLVDDFISKTVADVDTLEREAVTLEQKRALVEETLRSLNVEREKYAILLQGTRTVSYTHLTLPTIYSV